MKVKELIKELKSFPPDALVGIDILTSQERYEWRGLQSVDKAHLCPESPGDSLLILKVSKNLLGRG